MSTNPSFSNEDTYTPDNLIVGDADLVTETGRIVTAGALTRGTLLGRANDSSGEYYKTSLAAAGDGSEVPVAVLAQDVAVPGNDAAIYIAGEFNTRAMTFGAGHTAASTKNALAARGIYLKDSVAA